MSIIYQIPSETVVIKFTAGFEWNESRAIYNNLKVDSSQNTLNKEEVGKLWIPNLVYRNNKDNFDTLMGLDRAKLKVRRAGNFTRSLFDVVEEIEIFEGKQNPIEMIQSYTKVFKCKYNLEVFPFDTQVNEHKNTRKYSYFLGLLYQSSGGGIRYKRCLP